MATDTSTDSVDTTTTAATNLANIWAPSIPPQVQIPQMKHRLDIIHAMGIADLAHQATSSTSSQFKILEVGCGQGDTTAATCHLAGPNAHVTAVDPGDPEYGSPLTLSQAQGMVSAWFNDEGAMERVRFFQLDAPGLAQSVGIDMDLESETEHGQNPGLVKDQPGDIKSSQSKLFDVALASKSLFYFPSTTLIMHTLHTMRRLARRVAMAEYIPSYDGETERSKSELGVGNGDGGEVHVAATKAQAALYVAASFAADTAESISYDGTAAFASSLKEIAQEARALVDNFLAQGSNLCVAPTPEELKEIAKKAGLRCIKEEVVRSSEDRLLQDGKWDSDSVVIGSGKRSLEGRIEVVDGLLRRLGEIGKLPDVDTKTANTLSAAVNEGITACGEARRWMKRAQDVVEKLADAAAINDSGGAGAGTGNIEEKRKKGMKEVRTMDVWVAVFEVD